MVPTIALTRWRIDMATKKKPPQTEAPAPAIPGAAVLLTKPVPEPRPSPKALMARVANGFIFDRFDEIGMQNSRERQVARTPAELIALVQAWAAPTPKKR
jgi:hypothetical protein